MKLLVASDIHAEFYHFEVPDCLKHYKDADVLVLAGDTFGGGEFKKYLKFLKHVAVYHRRVLFVLGNHEYYKSSPQQVADRFLEPLKDILNLAVLTAEAPVEINGQQFYGDTFWYGDEPNTMGLLRNFSDYRYIKDLVPWVFGRNVAFRENFNQVKEGAVVITHHAPSIRSSTEFYKTDPYTALFYSDAEKLIVEKKPQLWVHGHMHDPSDYQIEGTRVVCHPRGYPFEAQSLGYQPLEIEIP